MELTHKELVEIGYKWTLNKCGFVFKEHQTTHDEIPDVLGFNSNGTFASLKEYLITK